MSSFRINFFKGKASQPDSPRPAKRELTIGAPVSTSSFAEEDIGPTDPAPPQRSTTPIIFNGSRTNFQSTTTFDGSSTFRRGSQADTLMADSILASHGPETSSAHSRNSTENVTVNKGVPNPSAKSKKAGAKLRHALSLLRKRGSNPNLRRAYVPTIGEVEERETSWGAFKEPLLDPDLVEPGEAAPRQGTDTSVAWRNENSKSHGFKFTLPVRSNTRHVLTKPPPRDAPRPRRATVASIMGETHPRDNSLWGGTEPEPRPRSSQSTDHGLAPEDARADSIFSHESPAIGIGGSSPGGGGLFPRPSSLQRHWSDGGVHKRDSDSRYIGNARIPSSSTGGFSQEKVRPVSLGGLSASNTNIFAGMKITEAATLENRVKRLEADITTLQEQVNTWTSKAVVHYQASETLPSEDQDIAHSSRSISKSSPNHSFVRTEPDEIQHQSDHQATLYALEGLNIDPGSKRNTVSTIKAVAQRNRLSSSHGGSSTATPPVSLAEHAGLIAMLKREQKARRRLESQVSALQEQMATVLHRQLVAQTGMSAMRVNDGFVPYGKERKRISREASGELVPTPDLTPPPTSENRPAANIFAGFDSDPGTEGGVDGSVYGRTADPSEVWETPVEDRDEILERPDTASSFGGTTSVFPDSGRTLSLSQLTQRRSPISPL